MTTLGVGLGLSALFTLPAFATAYEHGHSALEIWDAQGQANAPTWVQHWLTFLGLAAIAGILFVWKHVEARWVVGGFLLGLLVSRGVIPTLPILKLSGLVALVHLIFWSPALFVLLKNRPFTKGPSPYAIWSGIITSVILFSFIFDVRDSAIYLHHIATR